MLRRGFIYIVQNIVLIDNTYRLGVKRFLQVHDFCDIGMTSSNVRMYKCTVLCNDIFYIDTDEVLRKCSRTPFWNCSTDDEDKDLSDTSAQYIVAVLIHSEK